MNRPLRIAQVAPLWTRVPPKTYGGIELGVHLLTEELLRRGHDVTLFAAGDSLTSARLHAVTSQNIIDAMAAGEINQYDCYLNASLAEAIRDSDRFDVIHCHAGCALIPWSIVTETPVLHTIRTALDRDDCRLIERYPDVPVVAISRSQVQAVAEERRRRIRIVYNAVDFTAYDNSDETGPYLAFLGRMSADKNPVGAIRIAREAGLPIVLAGMPQSRAEEQFFTEKVRPLIDGENVRHIGAVDHPQKNALLRNAAALVFPILWAEPFGLVMIEAMACGTPVVACRHGSVAEVIDPGVTGFHADTPEELAPLVPQAIALDRRKVRAHAMERFHFRRMADDYERVYRDLLA